MALYDDTGLGNLPEDTEENIQAKISKLQRQYNEWDAFKYKDENVNKSMKIIVDEVTRLQSKLTEVKDKARGAGYAQEMESLIPEIIGKIGEFSNIQPSVLEGLIKDVLTKRMTGQVETVTPQAVAGYQPIVEQMYAPYEGKARESIKQQFSDIGRYYGGEHAGQQRAFTGELLGQKVSKGYEMASQDWARKQQLIDSALAGGFTMVGEERRRAELPIHTWLGTVPGIKGQAIAGKYNYNIPTYSYNPSYTPNYQYQPTSWEKWASNYLQGATEKGIDYLVGKSAGK